MFKPVLAVQSIVDNSGVDALCCNSPTVLGKLYWGLKLLK
jgi:hypothetical protein